MIQNSATACSWRTRVQLSSDGRNTSVKTMYNIYISSRDVIVNQPLPVPHPAMGEPGTPPPWPKLRVGRGWAKQSASDTGWVFIFMAPFCMNMDKKLSASGGLHPPWPQPRIPWGLDTAGGSAPRLPFRLARSDHHGNPPSVKPGSGTGLHHSYEYTHTAYTPPQYLHFYTFLPPPWGTVTRHVCWFDR